MNEELKIIISAEIDKLKTELNKGKKEIENFGKKSKVSAKEVGEGLTKAGDIGKKALAGIGAAVAGAATALLALSASTAEYRTAQAKLNSAFESAGSSVGQAKTTYNELYRVLGDGDVAVEAANHLAKLTTNEKELSEWTTICQGVYATFGDSLPIEGLTEAANETAKVGTLTGSLADALNWAGVNEEEFQAKLDACNTEAEREALIRTTLTGIYNEAAGAYEKNAADLIAQNEAQAKLAETTARLGEAFAPLNTMLTAFAADVLEKITPMLTEFAEEHGPTIEKTLGEIATAIGNVLSWVIDNWDLVSTIGAVVLGVATALSVFSTVMGIVNAVMLASPVTWIVLGIVAAVAALIAIIVLCVKHWDEIKAAVSNAIEKMKNAVSAGFEKIKSTISGAIEKIKGFFTGVLDFIKNNWQGLLLLIVNPFAGAFKLAYDNCEGFRKNVDGFIAKVKSMIQTGFNFVKERIINPIKEAFNNVKTIFTNIQNTISEKIEGAKNTVKNVIDAIKGFFNFKITWPKIPTPKFGIKPAGWKIGDLLEGVIPKLSITWNAKGGVFDKPTLFGYGNSLQGIGEDGAEAVVPLEKNTQWLDKIADRLAAKQGNVPIVLNVDGKVFAQTSINSINQLTRQTGKLSLNLV